MSKPFDENTQKGIIWFGEDGVQKILNEELPLYLNADGVSTLLRFIVNDLFLSNNYQ